MMRTTTIYNIIHSELIKRGYNEIVDNDGNLIYFDSDQQFMNKIFSYDEDISEIVDDLFNGNVLDDPVHDDHFKRNFFYRFINRQINRQTIESFKIELISTFMSNEDYINRLYADMDLYLNQTNKSEGENKQLNKQTNKQLNKQKTDGSTISDNRSAFADLPQSTANLDVDNTTMSYATDNTISRNRQKNLQDIDGITEGETDGLNEGNNKTESTIYQLDELFKTNGLLEQVYNVFDVKCFLQVW